MASKTCNFDCVYCQLGRTREKIRERREFVAIQEILDELRSWFTQHAEDAMKLRYLTLSGLGEPTLYTRIEEVISEIKRISAVPVAVITNASLLGDAAVRRSIAGADLVVPSLDAAVEAVFQAIDRPGPNIQLQGIIDGLIQFRREYRGKIWLEVMMVKGINDSLGHIRKLKEIIDSIRPDKIQVNSPVRSTAEEYIFSVEKNKLKKIRDILGEKAEIV